jgi:hypothetical protein
MTFTVIEKSSEVATRVRVAVLLGNVRNRELDLVVSGKSFLVFAMRVEVDLRALMPSPAAT